MGSQQPVEIFDRQRRNLTDQQRKLIVELLLTKSENTKLKKGALQEVATLFSVKRKTIAKIWHLAMSCVAEGWFIDVSSRLTKNSGRKRASIDFSKVAGIELRRRKCIRSLAVALDAAPSTLYRRMKEGEIRPHTNALKPHLTDRCKRARLSFCLSMIEPYSLHVKPIFKDMYNYVHIDEKWFYMTKDAERYYLHPSEQEPNRECKNKNFITKVMFLAAVARPRYDACRNETFSGKIGIFPYVYKAPAKRTSKNRMAGTMETKAITKVTKDETRECLINKVLPAIRAKWPRGNDVETIYIQQDNAKPHINRDDVDFQRAACIDGFDIKLTFQPPSSPDMNVLDLGYFRAIQSLQYREAPNTIDQLVSAVEKSFETLSSESLNHVFLSLQACMVEVMKCLGGNNYKLPHMGKKKMARNNDLPSRLKCNQEVVEIAFTHLQNGPN